MLLDLLLIFLAAVAIMAVLLKVCMACSDARDEARRLDELERVRVASLTRRQRVLDWMTWNLGPVGVLAGLLLVGYLNG